MKRGGRIIGIDDSPFTKSDRHVMIVGVVWRSGIIEGVLSSRVRRDGHDATRSILAMIGKSRFSGQVRAVMLNGIMVAGLNAVDINRISRELNVPVIAFTRRRPRMGAVARALVHVKGAAGKKAIIERAGDVYGEGPYIQCAGIEGREALKMLGDFGREPVRIAHLIASGIKCGESHGKAW